MRHSQVLCRLTGKGRCSCRDNDQKGPTAAILQLPLDILILVTDYLTLHDKFLLSHTCKAIRRITLQDWKTEVSRLSFEDQVEFWVGLAYTLPDRWACAKCCTLHPISILDVPVGYWTLGYSSAPCMIERFQAIEIERYMYSVEHRHIQLALKLSRLGNVHQQYLASLMRPYKCTHTRLPFILPLAESYTAKPRIINKRFILREEWKRSNNTSTILPLFPSHSAMRLSVCPHLRLIGGPMRSRSVKASFINALTQMSGPISIGLLEGPILFKEVTLLEDGIEMACEFPGQWAFNSCLHCTTDFAVMISTNGREATVRAWHDLGVEGSPLDVSWKAHLKKDRAHWLDVGPSVDYPSGSIRELWSEDSSHGAGTGQAKLRSVFTKLIDTRSEV